MADTDWTGDDMSDAICIVESCTRRAGLHSGKGMCNMHYKRSRAGADLLAPPGQRRSGAAHPQWRGEAATAEAKHFRIRTVRGMPASCIWSCTNVAIYEWANLTGDYDDIWDYAAMCRSCHRRYDNARRAMEENFTRHPGGPQGRFSASEIRGIRAQAAAGTTPRELATKLDYPVQVIRGIIRGDKYAWVSPLTRK